MRVVVDPTFLRRGRQPYICRGSNLLFSKIFAGNCMKMKNIGRRMWARVPSHCPPPPHTHTWIRYYRAKKLHQVKSFHIWISTNFCNYFDHYQVCKVQWKNSKADPRIFFSFTKLKASVPGVYLPDFPAADKTLMIKQKRKCWFGIKFQNEARVFLTRDRCCTINLFTCIVNTHKA